MMTRQHAPIKANMTQLRGIPARLSGRSFVLIRVALLALVVLCLIAFVASISTYAAYLHILCTSAACRNVQLDGSTLRLSLTMLHQLQEAHLSIEFYATSIVLLHLVLASGYLAMGTILLWRTSHNWLALLAAFCLVTFAIFRDITMLETLSPLWHWPVTCVSFLGEIGFGLFFYLFPSGRFVPRWVGFLWLGEIVYFGAVNFFPYASFNPFALNSVLNPLTFFGLLLSLLVVQVYRYRHTSNWHERLQTKWVFFGISVALGGQLGLTLLGVIYPSGAQNPLLSLIYQALFICFELLIPLSIFLAILSHRLWDIDIIITRTLVYGTLTACIIGIYVLVVGYVGALFRTGSNLLVSLLATGLVAVLFQPLRERLQSGVNRLLYGQRDEPYTVITRLGQRLEGTLVPDAVLSTIVETVAQALKLPYAAILLQQDQAASIATCYGRVVEPLLHLPLLYQSRQVGELLLAPRARGEAFTPADRRLLDDLARQVGVAAHAVQLTTDLQRSREHLVIAREEERRRLRRDLHDGLGPSLASITLKLDAVRNLLTRDPSAADTSLIDLKKQTLAAVADIRRLAYELRPPSLDELGSVPALREQAEQYHLDGLHVTLDAPESLPDLSAAVEVAAYRIVQEALTNVVRHAQAHTCTVRFALDHGLDVEVCDDGRGIPAGQRAGVGLTSIRERVAELAGICEIEAMPAGGTRLHVRLTLPKMTEREE